MKLSSRAAGPHAPPPWSRMKIRRSMQAETVVEAANSDAEPTPATPTHHPGSDANHTLSQSPAQSQQKAQTGTDDGTRDASKEG